MNYKSLIKISLLIFIITSLNACAFVPKTVKATSHETMSCGMVTSAWELDVVAVGGLGANCYNEACIVVFGAVPIITAVISLPIVLIGNSIHYAEKQLRCD
ncbi:hypothetical protein MNBD_GAMMA22-881 [hydrothermal vent metagenome]|uniref:Uncharacterized protein n=1 Tax=hydrothermal vent metagenome TaxID=652676 RepID=A0A3B1A9R0_9ZZZZ